MFFHRRDYRDGNDGRCDKLSRCIFLFWQGALIWLFNIYQSLVFQAQNGNISTKLLGQLLRFVGENPSDSEVQVWERSFEIIYKFSNFSCLSWRLSRARWLSVSHSADNENILPICTMCVFVTGSNERSGHSFCGQLQLSKLPKHDAEVISTSPQSSHIIFLLFQKGGRDQCWRWNQGGI